MTYTATRPGDKEIIRPGSNCDGCEAALAGDCEAFKAFQAVQLLGDEAIRQFTPGLRSTAREVSAAMEGCPGASEAGSFIRTGPDDCRSKASRTAVILHTAVRINRQTANFPVFPEPVYTQWEKERDARRGKRPQDRTRSGLWAELR